MAQVVHGRLGESGRKRPGHRSTSKNEENVQKVSEIVQKDQRLSF
jgi:hypothetical protein